MKNAKVDPWQNIFTVELEFLEIKELLNIFSTKKAFLTCKSDN